MHSTILWGLLHFLICARIGQNEILSCSENVIATDHKQACVFDDICFVLFVIVHVGRNFLTRKDRSSPKMFELKKTTKYIRQNARKLIHFHRSRTKVFHGLVEFSLKSVLDMKCFLPLGIIIFLTNEGS
jgi:hypothetical protein